MTKHPGVKQELTRSEFRVGGKIQLYDHISDANTCSAHEIKTEFQKIGWKQ